MAETGKTPGSDDLRSLRQAIRNGAFTGPTSGQGGAALQGNLVVLPRDDAADFLRFCQANPRPCPLLAVGEPGNPLLPVLGDVDIRSDLPRYRIWREGRLEGEPTDISTFWRDDLVSFVIGCSFSFEAALVEAGVPVRHMTAGKNVPMYRTNIPCRPAGAFHGPLVVSMRAMPAADAIEAVRICDRFMLAHGAPVHLGDPALIGIGDINRPDYGDAPVIEAGDIPVFWACGVTPQAVLAEAAPAFAITHAPGHMLITDIPASEAERRLTGVHPA